MSPGAYQISGGFCINIYLAKLLKFCAHLCIIGFVCKKIQNAAIKNGVIWFMNMRTGRKLSSFDVYVFVVLAAAELLMSFTFLGYIHVPPVSVTFAYVPILIAACLLGTVQSAVLGLVFGLASMYKATAFYVMPADMIFSPFLSGQPISSFFLAVGTRTLFGVLAGLLFFAAKKQKHARLWIGVATAVSLEIYSLLVYGAMGALFPGVGGGLSKLFPPDGRHILQVVVCICIVEGLWALHNSRFVKEFKAGIDNSDSVPYANKKKKNIYLLLFTVFIFGMTVMAAIYFSQRASYMLRRHGIAVSDAVSTDLIHLQIQFMLAVLSLNIISIIVLLSGYKYITYQKFLGELDVITGVMGRRIFLQCCEKAHRDRREGPPRKGWFLFLDVDNFKTINDTMGHATGDNVLKEVAAALKRVFGGCGIVGRMGGDEFAAMIDDVSVEESDMRTGLDLFLAQIGEILPHSVVSSSIGVCRFEYPADIQRLMHETDKLLYEAKHRGRACYVFGEYKKED